MPWSQLLKSGSETWQVPLELSIYMHYSSLIAHVALLMSTSFLHTDIKQGRAAMRKYYWTSGKLWCLSGLHLQLAGRASAPFLLLCLIPTVNSPPAWPQQ